MPTYTIEISETIVRTVEIEALSLLHAKRFIKNNPGAGKLIEELVLEREIWAPPGQLTKKS